MALACCLISHRRATLVTLIVILQGRGCPLCNPHPQGFVIRCSKWTADGHLQILNLFLVATYWPERNETLIVSLAVSLKAVIPPSLWVLTTFYNLHLNFGVLEFPGGRIFFPDVVFGIYIVVFIYVAVLGAGSTSFAAFSSYVGCPFTQKILTLKVF